MKHQILRMYVRFKKGRLKPLEFLLLVCITATISYKLKANFKTKVHQPEIKVHYSEQ